MIRPRGFSCIALAAALLVLLSPYPRPDGSRTTGPLGLGHRSLQASMSEPAAEFRCPQGFIEERGAASRLCRNLDSLNHKWVCPALYRKVSIAPFCVRSIGARDPSAGPPAPPPPPGDAVTDAAPPGGLPSPAVSAATSAAVFDRPPVAGGPPGSLPSPAVNSGALSDKELVAVVSAAAARHRNPTGGAGPMPAPPPAVAVGTAAAVGPRGGDEDVKTVGPCWPEVPAPVSDTNQLFFVHIPKVGTGFLFLWKLSQALKMRNLCSSTSRRVGPPLKLPHYLMTDASPCT